MEHRDALSRPLQHEEKPTRSNTAPTCPSGQYEQLRPTQNGCGSQAEKAFQKLVTNTLEELPSSFHSCCNSHDVCYGTCRKTKAACDNAFKTCLNKAASKFSDAKKTYYKGTATVVANAVIVAGAAAYAAGQKTFCKCSNGKRLRWAPKSLAARAMDGVKRGARTGGKIVANVTRGIARDVGKSRFTRVMRRGGDKLVRAVNKTRIGNRALRTARAATAKTGDLLRRGVRATSEMAGRAVFRAMNLGVASAQLLNRGIRRENNQENLAKIAERAAANRRARAGGERRSLVAGAKAAASRAKAAVRRAATRTAGAAAKATRVATDKVKAVASRARAAARTAAGKVSRATAAAKRSVVAKAQRAASAAKDVARRAKATSRRAAAGLKRAAADAKRGAADKVKRAASATKRAASRAKANVRRAAAKVKRTAATKAKRTVSAVKRIVTRARSAARKATRRVRAAVRRVVRRRAPARRRATRRRTPARKPRICNGKPESNKNKC